MTTEVKLPKLCRLNLARSLREQGHGDLVHRNKVEELKEQELVLVLAPTCEVEDLYPGWVCLSLRGKVGVIGYFGELISRVKPGEAFEAVFTAVEVNE